MSGGGPIGNTNGLRHGHASGGEISRTYRSWNSMRSRCLYASHKSYPIYGGAGITICERWHEFFNFLQDMGERPENHSLERIENSKGYEPSNCRWATCREQSLNRRTTRWLTFESETLCLAEWARRIGITHGGLRRRLRAGWSVHDALTTKNGGGK